jgi:hypothetical protein
LAFNYIIPTGDPQLDINTSDDSCEDVILGCTEFTADNYNPDANTIGQNLNGCLYSGCTLSNFPNYNSIANLDDGSCSFSSLDIFGCMNELYLDFDSTANMSNNTCDSLIILGCTNSNQFGFDVSANVDDGSCEEIIEGCTNILYLEYLIEANTDDGSCINIIVEGCIDPLALNYDASISSQRSRFKFM